MNKKLKQFILIFLMINILNSCEYEDIEFKNLSNLELINTNDTTSLINKIPQEQYDKIINSVQNLLYFNYNNYTNNYSTGINILSYNALFRKYNPQYDLNKYREYYLKYETNFYNAVIQKVKFGDYIDVGDIELKDVNSKIININKYNINEIINYTKGVFYNSNSNYLNYFNINGVNVNITNTYKENKKNYQIYCPLRFDGIDVDITPFTVNKYTNIVKRNVLIDDTKPNSEDNIKLIEDTTINYDDFIDLTKSDIDIKWNPDINNKNGVIILIKWTGRYYKEEDPFNVLYDNSFSIEANSLYIYKLVKDNGKNKLTKTELNNFISKTPQYINAYVTLFRLSIGEFEFDDKKYPITCGAKIINTFKMKLK